MTGRRLKLAVVAVLVVAGGLAMNAAARRLGIHDPAVAVTGTIEALQVDVSPKITGRIVERAVREGDRVHRGQLLVRLDADELAAEMRRAEAAVRITEARLRDMLAGARAQEIEQARQALVNATATRVWTERDYSRATELFKKDLIAAQEVDRARQAYEVAKANEVGAREKLALIEAGAREYEIVTARALVAEARAALALAERRLEQTRLVSTLDGVVLHKNMEVGETAVPGQSILTLMDPRDLWLRAYVPETEIARVKLGQPATLAVDAFPGRVFQGIVSEIASEAEFTPKNVQTKKERVNLVFRVKIAVQNPDGTLKPGLPADAEIRP